MPRYFFPQCAAVLLDDVPGLEEVEKALADWPISPQTPAEGSDGWMVCGAGVAVERRGPSVPGRRPERAFAIADIVERPWPDDPKVVKETPALSEAWRSGAFGFTSEPGALARAEQQSWLWPGGAAAAKRHRAVLRVRTAIPMPEAGKAELPKGYDPIHDLSTLTELAASLLHLPAATGLFFPGGEALRSPQQVEEVMARKTGIAPTPVELWVNIRALGLGRENEVTWVLADTVGMRQLRLPDLEAIFAEGQEQPDAIASMLREACLHLAAGKGIADGSTTDDARGRRWKASSATSLLVPQRPCIRWLPEASAKPSEAFLARGKAR